LFFFIIFNLVFGLVKIDKTIAKNALEIIYTNETWGTDIVNINIFVKNNKTLTYIKDAPIFINLTYLYLKKNLEKLSVEKGFSFKLSSNLEFNTFLINIDKNNFIENYKEILDTFLSINIEEEIFSQLKQELNYKNSSISSYIYSSKSIIHKFNNLDFFHVKHIDFNNFKDFIGYYLSPNNILISLTNFKDITFLKKHIEKYKSKFLETDKTNSYFDIVQAIPKRLIKLRSLQKTSSLKLGLSASRCMSKENIISELFINIAYPAYAQTPVMKYNCFSSFAYFEYSFNNIDRNVDDLIFSFRNNLRQISKELDHKSFSYLKNSLLSKYDLILFNKSDFMYLLGKTYIITGSLNYFFSFKNAVNSIDLEEFKKFIIKISESNFYEIVIKG